LFENRIATATSRMKENFYVAQRRLEYSLTLLKRGVEAGTCLKKIPPEKSRGLGVFYFLGN
jgi:hypothetical protein